MKKLFLALALTTVVCLALAAVAAADPGSTQGTGQSAATSQQAGAASGATQIDPSNANISIRVLSPGDDGAVSQSNTVGSTASAGNRAGTTQSAGQTAAGSAIQIAQQQAGTDQLALALSAAQQVGADNTNTPVRVLSPGTDGPVTQSNTAASQAASGSSATTGQSATQDAGGSSCGCGGPAIQTAKQSSGTGQASGAASSATQDHPSNTNVSIRVLSPGGSGPVSQSNTASSTATSGNAATTGQQATQSQAGGGCGCTIASDAQPASAETAPAAAPAAPAPAPAGVQQSNGAGSSASSGNSASTGQNAQQGGSGSGIQTGDQSAATEQLSGAESSAEQIAPSNTAGSIRVFSPGNDGAVSQSNTAASSATSGNSAGTTQSAGQSQGGSCGCGSTTSPIQISGQDATTAQGSLAASEAKQIGASNVASPVRVWSGGNGGDVSQSNTVGSSASSGNAATTGQQGTQSAGGGCGCGSAPIQVLGQQSGTEQGSVALSQALQAFGREGRGTCGCGGGGSSSGNVASPVRVYSPGSDGSTTQSNTVGSSATSGNRAATTQSGWQGAGGSAIQVLGQQAKTGQLSAAASLAAQLGASNVASPVRVLSPGGGGAVTQQNAAGSSAASGNDSGTGQAGRQESVGGSCGCRIPPIQVIGQKAETGQLSKGLSAAWQLAPANTASPVSVGFDDHSRTKDPAYATPAPAREAIQST